MRARLGIDDLKLFIAAAFMVGACGSSAREIPPLPAGLKLPVFVAVKARNNAGNLSVAVSATDAAGLSPGQPGYAGASLDGECRIYLDNVKPVTSDELYDRAFVRLDAAVKAAGGIEAILKKPERIPVVHIWGDIKAPWRCIAGVISNVRAAGYPTVCFISIRLGSSNTVTETDAAYIDLPAPTPVDAPTQLKRVKNEIVLTSQNRILWNGKAVTAAELASNLTQSQALPVKPSLEFAPEADAGYNLSAAVLNVIRLSHVRELDFVDSEKYRSFGKDESGADPTRSDPGGGNEPARKEFDL